jgi:fluoride ion exporter CrcB/FEX
VANIASLTFVFIGGALGSLLRWWLGRVIGEHSTGKFPLGTFVINVTDLQQMREERDDELISGD